MLKVPELDLGSLWSLILKVPSRREKQPGCDPPAGAPLPRVADGARGPGRSGYIHVYMYMYIYIYI